ncbi:MAG: hypothetical protein NVSMB21_12300 [Vulcanimicrobiaceae bacterium]
MNITRTIARGGISASLAIVGVLNVGPLGSFATIARADAPPVFATLDRVANRKGDEGVTHPIYITFRNTAPVAANEVRFAVRQGQDSVEVSDVGTFATGVDIAHRFANPSTSFATPWQPARVTVTYVRFTDGTTWTPQERSQARVQ